MPKNKVFKRVKKHVATPTKCKKTALYKGGFFYSLVLSKKILYNKVWRIASSLLSSSRDNYKKNE